MDFDKLLNPVAEYLDFFVDFVLFGGISPYARQGSVSPKLLSFFFIGLILSLIIKRLKRLPTFADDSELRLRQRTPPSTEEGLFGLSRVLEISELMAFVPFLISGSVFFHLSLLASSGLYDFSIGNFKDSINATIMVSAIANPIQASFTRFLGFIKQIENYNKLSQRLAAFSYLSYLLFTFAQAYYYLYAITIIHDISFGQVWLPLAITTAFVVLFILIVNYGIETWRKMHEPEIPIRP